MESETRDTMSESVEEKFHPAAPTTRWSLILAAADRVDSAAQARDALDQLCRIYWRPVLQFIVRKGYSLPDAQDLTQDFFLRLAGPEFLRRASPEKGRFRSLVFASLKNLMCDAADRVKALRRGGGERTLCLEEWMKDESQCDGALLSAPAAAEDFFDYDWAAQVVRKALARLQDEFAARGRCREFAVVRGFLAGGEKPDSYAAAAASLNCPTGTAKAIVHRLRTRYGALLREEVAHTVADERDLQDEIRHLRRILATHQDALKPPAGHAHGD